MTTRIWARLAEIAPGMAASNSGGLVLIELPPNCVVVNADPTDPELREGALHQPPVVAPHCSDADRSGWTERVYLVWANCRATSTTQVLAVFTERADAHKFASLQCTHWRRPLGSAEPWELWDGGVINGVYEVREVQYLVAEVPWNPVVAAWAGKTREQIDRLGGAVFLDSPLLEEP